jgi:hypothetical protein
MRQTSLSTRFCVTLIAIVAVLMTGFAVGLEAPLWNLDNRVVAGYLDSLVLDDAVVFARVLSDDGTVITRARPEVQGLDFAALAGSGGYTARDAPIEKDGQAIGRLELAMSHAAMHEEIAITIAAIIALAAAVLATVTTASIVISRRYVARPLSNLQRSAAAIGAGDLQTAASFRTGGRRARQSRVR